MLRRSTTAAVALCAAAALGLTGLGAVTGHMLIARPRAEAAAAAVSIPVAGRPPTTGVPWFLAIGDSITFGYTMNPRLAGTNISWPGRLQRMLAAEGRSWSLYDVACPGETTLTYATRCRSRGMVPFLARQSQRQAALRAITTHGDDLRLIVVALGANDVLGVLHADPAAIGAQLAARLTGILDELRAAAPGVPVVLADVYDPFAAREPASDAVLATIDDAVAALADRLHDGFADFRAAINHPADGAALCSLIDCADHDIHPTVLGQERLAEAVLGALPPGNGTGPAFPAVKP
jgi:lysophospholipase L1-like esterase